MSISSHYSEHRFVDVHFKDGSCISFELQIPLEITLENYNDPECDESTAIKREELEAEMPEIESEPVQHGRWIETGYNPVGDTMYCDCNCSNCNFEITREKGRYPKFCENCGTRMDGGSDND